MFNLRGIFHFWKSYSATYTLSRNLVARFTPSTTASFSLWALSSTLFNKLFSSNKLTRNNLKTPLSRKMLDVATRWPGVIKQVLCATVKGCNKGVIGLLQLTITWYTKSAMLEGKLIIFPALGHQSKDKSRFTGLGLFVLISQYGNNNELALQHGGLCTTWSLVAKGLLRGPIFFSCPGAFSVMKRRERRTLSLDIAWHGEGQKRTALLLASH